MKLVEGVLAVEVARGQEVTQRGKKFVVHSSMGRDIREDVAKELVSAGYGLLMMQPHTLSLEDIFLKLTMDEPVEEGDLNG